MVESTHDTIHDTIHDTTKRREHLVAASGGTLPTADEQAATDRSRHDVDLDGVGNTAPKPPNGAPPSMAATPGSCRPPGSPDGT